MNVKQKGQVHITVASKHFKKSQALPTRLRCHRWTIESQTRQREGGGRAPVKPDRVRSGAVEDLVIFLQGRGVG